MTQIQQDFFDGLDRFGKGERAALRRAAGVMLQAADGGAISAFYRCLPPAVDRWQEPRWFAVACLSCLWDVGSGEGTPLEQIISDRMNELSDSTAHRVEILLDTRWDADGYMLSKLTRLVKLIRQKTDRARPDFAALLDDLIYWNAENQSVQRKWARAVFSRIREDEKE